MNQCPTKSQSTTIYKGMEIAPKNKQTNKQTKTEKKTDEIDDYEVRKLSYCLTRFPQWLDSVVIIHRRGYYDYDSIFLAEVRGMF